MDKLYQTVESQQKPDFFKVNQYYFTRPKQPQSHPESINDHQSSTSVQLSDSRQTFQHRFRVTSPEEPDRQSKSISTQQQNPIEHIDSQRNKLIFTRQIGEIIGFPNLSFNDLKQKIKRLALDNQTQKQTKPDNNEDLSRSQISIYNQHLLKKQSQADRVIHNKNEVMGLAVKNLNETIQRHRRDLEEIFNTFDFQQNKSQQPKDKDHIISNIQKITEKNINMQRQISELLYIKNSSSFKIKELEQSLNNLIFQNSKMKNEHQTLLQDQTFLQQNMRQMIVLRQNEEKYKQKISQLQQTIQQINCRSGGGSELNSQDTPTFKLHESTIRDLNVSLLRQKQEENRQLIVTIQQLNNKIQQQIQNGLKNSKTSSNSSNQLINYCKQLEAQLSLLRKQKQVMDRGIQDSQKTIKSKDSFCSLKNKIEEIEGINCKLADENNIIKSKIEYVSSQVDRDSKIDQLNSVMSDMNSLRRDLALKSQQLQSVVKKLQSKEQQLLLRNKIIEQKNSEIKELKTQKQNSLGFITQQTKQAKKQILILQQALQQSIETHERHSILTNQQVQTLKQIGINLQKQNTQLLEMIKQYEQQISKLIKNGNITQRPQSLKSEIQNEKITTRASMIKKQLDHIMASLECKANLDAEKAELKDLEKKEQTVFKNPFDTSKTFSGVNYNTPINIVKISEVQKTNPQVINLKSPHKQYMIPSTNIKCYPKETSQVGTARESHFQSQMPRIAVQRGLLNKTPNHISPTLLKNDSPSSRIIILDKRNSKSKDKIIRKRQTPVYHTSIFQNPKPVQYIGQKVVHHNSPPQLSLQSFNKAHPNVQIQISQKSTPSFKSNPYFQQKSMKTISEATQKSESKTSIKLQSLRASVSKPSTSQPSIYNLEVYKNSKQLLMPNQGVLVKKTDSKTKLEPQSIFHSDCC